MATDVLSMSVKDGVALMDYNGEFQITELDRLTARFAGKFKAFYLTQTFLNGPVGFYLQHDLK